MATNHTLTPASLHLYVTTDTRIVAEVTKTCVWTREDSLTPRHAHKPHALDISLRRRQDGDFILMAGLMITIEDLTYSVGNHWQFRNRQSVCHHAFHQPLLSSPTLCQALTWHKGDWPCSQGIQSLGRKKGIQTKNYNKTLKVL